MEPIFSEFSDAHNLFINCRACQAEAVFNTRCRTGRAEQERQVEVDRWKREHVCGVQDAQAA